MLQVYIKDEQYGYRFEPCFKGRDQLSVTLGCDAVSVSLDVLKDHVFKTSGSTSRGPYRSSQTTRNFSNATLKTSHFTLHASARSVEIWLRVCLDRQS